MNEDIETTAVDVPAVTEANLIETILGARGAGEQILMMNGLLGIARLSSIALAERAGISVEQANRLAAAFELGRRMLRAATKKPKRLKTPQDVAAFFAPMLSGIIHEELHIAALDGRGRVRGTRMISRGGIGGAFVKPADVLRGALELGAVSFIMVHNHPSGDPTPSTDDIMLTHEIEHAAHLLGMPLLDHVIVTPAGKFASALNL
ncbi:MAG: JAB domain-containing protein [Polyangiaceae bacterium]|nr:JAB domain-containing protein [Polyangiaceae bacterium]